MPGKKAIEFLKNLGKSKKVSTISKTPKPKGKQLDLFNEYPHSPPGSLTLPDGRELAREWVKKNKSKNLKGTKADFEVSWKNFINKKGWLKKKKHGGPKENN